MPITEEQYRKLKQSVETAKAEADRAQGALDQLMHRLEEEFECKTLKEAKTKLKQIQAEKKEAEDAFEKEMKNYQKKWKTEKEIEGNIR